MKSVLLTALVLLFSFFSVSSLADPPFNSSLSIGGDIINENDPTTFVNLVSRGFSEDSNVFLFDAIYSDGLSVEFKAGEEFGSVEASSVQVNLYASMMGRLPYGLREDVVEIRIHQGDGPISGGAGVIGIQTEKALQYGSKIEEVLIHEAGHSTKSFGNTYDASWIEVQQADGEYISNYARDYSRTEDITESYLAYLALRYRSDRINELTAQRIAETIPNRIAYFDNIYMNMYPF